jgi:hypothetical protein
MCIPIQSPRIPRRILVYHDTIHPNVRHLSLKFENIRNSSLTFRRVVEMHIGIVCSCMPIIFVVFKRTGNSFITRLLNYRVRRSKRSTKEEIPYSTNPSTSAQSDVPQIKLPQVPRPVMTGMRSFIWKGTRSKPPTQGASQMISLKVLDSINDDYHQQLKGSR